MTVHGEGGGSLLGYYSTAGMGGVGVGGVGRVGGGVGVGGGVTVTSHRGAA